MSQDMRGKFITFEGGEGAGKSTQIRLLADRLRQAGHDVVTTREPGGSPGAEAIRKLLVEGAADRWDPAAETLLHFAARRDHLVRTILPALDSGRWVLSDRFADSTAVYQGHAQGMALEAIAALYRIAVGDLKPDLTIILDLPVAVGLERAAARRGPEARYESFGEQFHEKVRAGFRSIASAEPGRCALIDADAPIAEVAERVAATVATRLGS